MATGRVNVGGGVDTSDATAIASDILLSKTAYANGEMLIGTMAVAKKVASGTTSAIAVNYNNTLIVSLDFKPSIIMCSLSGSYGKYFYNPFVFGSSLLFAFGNSGSVVSLGNNGGYVNATGFKFTGLYNIGDYKWVAYE